LNDFLSQERSCIALSTSLTVPLKEKNGAIGGP